MKKVFKKSISVLMIVLMCLTMAPLQGFVGLKLPDWFATAAAAADFISIDSAEDFYNIKKNLSANYRLMSNISLSSYADWQSLTSGGNYFSGEFDGNGYTISDINITNYSNASLFGYVRNAKIHDLHITDINIDINTNANNFSVSTLCVTARDSEIYDCSVSGKIKVESEKLFRISGFI